MQSKEDRHPRVEGNEVRRSRSRAAVLQSGFSAAAREAEGARGWTQLSRVKQWNGHVIDGDRGPERLAHGLWEGK